MTDHLEELLMATLDDDRRAIGATSDHFAGLDAEITRLQRRRFGLRLATVAAVAVLALGATVAVTAAQRSRPALPTAPAPLPSAPLGGTPRRITFEGTGVGLVTVGNELWLLRAAADGAAVLERRDLSTGRVLSTLTPPGGAPGGLVADGARSVWVWAGTAGEPTVLTEYDVATQRVLRTVSRLMVVRTAAAADGSLWFAGRSQAYVVRPGSTTEHGVDGAAETTEHLVLDAARHQVVFAGLRIVVSADTATGAGIERAAVRTEGADVTLSGDGSLWLSGQDAGQSVVRLDPTSLEPLTDVAAVSGPQAPVRLFGGRAVVWMAGADGLLACTSAKDGSALERWSPEQTGRSPVLAVTTGEGRTVRALTSSALLVLPLDGCPG